MKSKPIITILILILLGMSVVLGFMLKKPKQIDTATPAAASNGQNQSIWKPQLDLQAGIKAEVTPVDLSANASEWKFNVAINTHSGSLDQDLLRDSILKDSQGNIYKPTNWQGAPEGGHHRSGVLFFRAITPQPKSITLLISGVGGIKRTFTWNLQ